MGAVEEGGKVASSVVTSLQSQPIILAVVVFNFVFMGAVLYLSYYTRESHERTINLLLEKQDKMATMLYNCTPSGNKTGLRWDLLSNPYIKPIP